MKINHKLDVIFVLDKSGSMSNNTDETISNFNEYLEKEKNNKYETFVTTMLFNQTNHFLHKALPVHNIKPLTKKDYYAQGCTALYDALGDAIHYMENKKTDKVLFVIITDGYENASVKYNQKTIFKKINSHKDWEFLYIGADIDSYQAGGDIGIRRERIANFKKGKTGTSKLFRAIENFEYGMMSEEADYDLEKWKDELD